ncbi:uncharacterized protein LOC107487452 [Arachis duranensis]|uniref:Protein preY, mitochondrial n=1 Tax=Arachis duranensis TaxID=130453 RepID=A0A6P4DEG0_ARADU|nr:uncharacterized protein LOC107487452 [Arachis duranensis]XP_025651663.1 uncharacterized protein LOC112747707 [Arachis hypogaea]QHO40368.1 UPF0434 protein [Arachis hypogaea]
MGPVGKRLWEVLVCPLSKHPLRYCQETNSLISDAIAVSFPIKNGIPCLVPQDGKILEEQDATDANSSAMNEEHQGRR